MTRDEILAMPAGREMRQAMIDAGLWDANDPRDPTWDKAAIWEVVEKMKSNGYNFYSEWSNDNRTTPDPWAMFMKPDGYMDYNATAPTMPLAICRAALLTTL